MWRITLLVILIGAGLYINQVVVPATPPLFVPTATPTTSPESFVNKGDDYFKAGKLPQAIDAYKEAISTDPENAANFVTLARLEVFAGQYDDAILNAQNALLKNPNNPLAHAVQGWALGFQQKYGDAELEINRALDLDANNALAHAYNAEILINQSEKDFGLVDKAIAESKLARDLDSTLLETHRARGIVLLNTNNLEQAVEEFNAALAINKNIADLQLYLGITYKAMEKYDLAQEALQKAYTLNPKDTTALIELSKAYFADGRYAQATQYAEEAAKIDPTNPHRHGYLGVTYYKQEMYDKAIPELALAVKGGTVGDDKVVKGFPLAYDPPQIMEYYWYYGFALARSHRCPEAFPVFQALLTGVPDNETAVYNANAGIEICKADLGTPTAPVTPEATEAP